MSDPNALQAVEQPEASQASGGIIAGVVIGVLVCGAMIYLIRRVRRRRSAVAKPNLLDMPDAENGKAAPETLDLDLESPEHDNDLADVPEHNNDPANPAEHDKNATAEHNMCESEIQHPGLETETNDPELEHYIEI